jgi:hypothetical protein
MGWKVKPYSLEPTSFYKVINVDFFPEPSDQL